VPVLNDPFTSDIPEVPLNAAPLARVIAQIRFPVVASFARLDGIGEFQNAIKAEYPILRPEKTQTFLVGQQGVELKPVDATVWRFHDKTDRWRVALSTDFIAIETTVYTGRVEFLNRLRVVLAALQESAGLSVYDRLGIRYVNRVSGKLLEDLSELVRPEVLGIAGRKFGAQLIHSFTESSFAMPAGLMNVRWGRIPAGATPDPGAIAPLNEDSWLLDLDMFTVTSSPFELDKIVGLAETFSATIYSFFRWSVEDEFLRRFGGNP
jgi:uncharacterized protein (TIGR04255 family)